MSGEVDTAERVEAQPPAGAGLREGPECQRRLYFLGDSFGDSGIGEGDLQDQHQIEPLLFQLGQLAACSVLVEEQRLGADDLGVESTEGGEGSRCRLLRVRHVEGAARQRHHGGRRRVGLNLIGLTPAGENLDLLWERQDELPWRRAVRWAQSALALVLAA